MRPIPIRASAHRRLKLRARGELVLVQVAAQLFEGLVLGGETASAIGVAAQVAGLVQASGADDRVRNQRRAA
jgi:hypothetical protein